LSSTAPARTTRRIRGECTPSISKSVEIGSKIRTRSDTSRGSATTMVRMPRIMRERMRTLRAWAESQKTT
jgi:hypothetical protein